MKYRQTGYFCIKCGIKFYTKNNTHAKRCPKCREELRVQNNRYYANEWQKNQRLKMIESNGKT